MTIAIETKDKPSVIRPLDRILVREHLTPSGNQFSDFHGDIIPMRIAKILCQQAFNVPISHEGSEGSVIFNSGLGKSINKFHLELLRKFVMSNFLLFARLSSVTLIGRGGTCKILT